MKTDAFTPSDLASSVLAVPPLARDASMRISASENERLLDYLGQGGVTTVLYGGNANIYHIADDDYEGLLDALPGWVGDGTWVIPSIGPSYGQLIGRARMVGARGYPTAMALPFAGPSTPDGTATGLRRASEAMGAPLILYLKSDGYLSPSLVGALVDDGTVGAIKYAVVREVPQQDDYLAALLDEVAAERIVSGIGERPAIVHLRDFGLGSFTSGSVCVAPAASTSLLRALQEGSYGDAEEIREMFLPLEDLRDGYGPIQVLHDAVTEAGIADMGPILPLLSSLDGQVRRRVGSAAADLAQGERQRSEARKAAS